MSYAIGVDLGGTKTEVCLVDAGTGAVLVSARRPTMPMLGAPPVERVDPVMIVIGGGLGLRTSYRTVAVEEMRPLVESAVSRTIAVVPAALGAQSGAIGAALLAANEAATRRIPTGRG